MRKLYRPKHKAWSGSAPWTVGMWFIAASIPIAATVVILTAVFAPL